MVVNIGNDQSVEIFLPESYLFSFSGGDLYTHGELLAEFGISNEPDTPPDGGGSIDGEYDFENFPSPTTDEFPEISEAIIFDAETNEWSISFSDVVHDFFLYYGDFSDEMIPVMESYMQALYEFEPETGVFKTLFVNAMDSAINSGDFSTSAASAFQALLHPDETAEETEPGDFNGSADDDYIEGSGGDDTIFGMEGSDELYGKNGDDTLNGGAGEDYLSGGKGNDTLIGGSGDDFIAGKKGNDELYGDNGDDTLKGGAGEDYLSGGKGNDTLIGGSGDDFIVGKKGRDELYGGKGDDTLKGGEGKD